MNKNKKITLLTLASLCSIFVGCSKDSNNKILSYGHVSKLKINEEFSNNSLVSDSIELDSSNNEDNSINSDVNQDEENSSTENKNNTNNKDSDVSTNKNSLKPSNLEGNKTQDTSIKEVSQSDSTKWFEDVTLVSSPVFKRTEITESIKARMEGKSMKENSNISYEDLSYLTITYLDYNGNTKQGEMVVHEKLADEVLDIFRDIYYAKFPIEKMSLIDDYNANDHLSMVSNNSSAFCYRTIAGTNKVSKHGMGVAIDINPFYNPHVLKSSGKVNPSEASKYANRSLNAKGMIKKNDAVYKAFTSRGWTWGGNWNNPDYQHFEKTI